jgi:hypothetical protein
MKFGFCGISFRPTSHQSNQALEMFQGQPPPVTPQEHQISTYLNYIPSISRSTKRSITIPNPVRDALSSQIENGVLDYPSENAAWIGRFRPDGHGGESVSVK